ncbi:MAG: MFS transporter [Burkholderiales bacterium]|nr:MFS transporter [Burkholderiales bacterium]
MRLLHVVPLLGVAQIISWGTLYYTIGVLGQPMREAAGVSELFLYGCFTVSLLLSGILAPAIGKMIDAHGGRLALSSGSLAAATSLTMLAFANGPILLVIGWTLAGAAMAATLYDPAFATLNQLTREHYRRAVTALTLFGGFASTVFWPLTHLLVDPLGWRGTLLVYAGLHLFICLPVHAFTLRHAHRLVLKPTPTSAHAAATLPQASAQAALTFRWLALSFVGASFVISIVGVHMISLLTGSGLSTPDAVLVGMLMGPMQVAGRLVEMGLLSKARAAHVGLGAIAMIFMGVLMLLVSQGEMVGAVLFVAAYGCGNGVFTIVRGTAPAELIGRDQLGALLGRLSRPAMIAKALAPATFTGLLALGLTRDSVLALLGLVMVGAWTSFLCATRQAGRRASAVTAT